VRTAEHIFVIALLIALSFHIPPLRADEWEDLRKRPGNDDIFVMVDTSLSMAPSVGGSLTRVKGLLQDLLVRYVKDGDRIIVMTFDSEAHMRGIIPILDRRRDTEVLRDVIDGIDARRVIRYSGTYPKLVEARDGLLTGGGAWTDYCDMWRLSATAIRKYGEPRHRQLFLLFTDGRPEAPLYRPCSDPGVLSAFSAGLNEDRFRMGLIALPGGRSSVQELSTLLKKLVRHMPGYDNIPGNIVRVIDFTDNSHRADGIRREILALIGARIDLVEPAKLTLGAHYKVSMNTRMTVVNRSTVSRAISLRGATLNLIGRGKPIDVAVTPSRITLLPGQSGFLTISAQDFLREPGEYRGTLVFNFGTASRFDPATLELSATKLYWWQAFGGFVTETIAALATLLLAALVRMLFLRRLVDRGVSSAF
jgi:hypothetical protein